MTTDSRWPAVSCDSAAELIDMTSGQEGPTWGAIAREQLLGAVDLYDRLGKRRVAWLCDEVGLGKTYVAMAVAALVRRQHPNARILYLLPSSRLLPKWTRELNLFSRRNVREVDHHLRTLQDRPARPLVAVDTLHELALESTLEPDRDFLCTLGAFSFGLPAEQRDWRASWEQLMRLLPEGARAGLDWEALTSGVGDVHPEERKLQVKVAVAEVINRVLPDFDLVVCDESHNLRDGLQSAAARNRLLSVSLGGVFCRPDREPARRLLPADRTPALRRHARRVLMLTATPFRSDYAELTRQASVFGFHRQGQVEVPPVVAELESLAARSRGDAPDEAELVREREQTVQSFIVRRLGTLEVNGTARSRNQYRTELRQGGMDRTNVDAGLPTPKVRQRLLLALVQKRVLDVLQPKDSSTGWRFQMGLLSSFESFGQTLDRTPEKNAKSAHEGEASEEGRSTVERESHALDALISSYQHVFKERMPHPKLEHVAKAVARDAWRRGEKALVFVRRVKTTEELATRITWHFDDQLAAWLRSELPPRVVEDWDAVWGAFDAYRTRLRLPTGANTSDAVRSLFGWYFRDHKADTEPEAVGGALARHGLETSRPWSVWLEDNAVLVLFGHDEAALRAWANQREKALLEGAWQYAFIDQTDGSVVKKRDPGSVAWFMAMQAAALDCLVEEHGPDSARGRLARCLRLVRFPDRRRGGHKATGPHGSPADWLVLPTLFSRLQHPRHAALRAELWGVDTLPQIEARLAEDSAVQPGEQDMVKAILEREQRQVVFAQLLRSGRSYLDLWLSVVHVQTAVGVQRPLDKVSVQLNYADRNVGPEVIATVVQPRLAELVTTLVERLERGRPPGDASSAVDAPGQPLTGWLELARVCRHFDLLRTLNFPRIGEVDPARARVLLRATLTGLEPAIALHGSSKTRRALEQFRMPGFPMVMVATSVVQEGVDLHTFCRKVVHYGIDGSATGTEQRNGRVDRRGSLISRLLVDDGDQTIDVYFPHLRQSLEPLQMASLFRKMNRFLLMANKLGADAVSDSQDVLCAISQQFDHPASYPKPYTGLLQTAFPAYPPPKGECVPLAPAADAVRAPTSLQLGPGVSGVRLSDPMREGAHLRWRTTASFVDVDRSQPLLLEIHSGLDRGHATLVVESPVWPFDVDVQGRDKRLRAARQHRQLVSVLRHWARPAGVHLVTRRRSRTRINLYLRAEVPLPGPVPDEAAVTAWLCQLARDADGLERLIGAGLENSKDHRVGDF